MTGITITAELDDKAVRDGLGRVRHLMADSTPLMRALGLGFVAATQDRLGGTVGPDGSPWPSLNPAYAATKRQAGMLRERGMQGGLQGSLTFDAAPGTVRWGSNKVYAAIHQFGGRIVPKNATALQFRLGEHFVRVKSVTIPARPYLGIGPGEREVIEDIVPRFLDGALRGA